MLLRLLSHHPSLLLLLLFLHLHLHLHLHLYCVCAKAFVPIDAAAVVECNL